MLGYAKSRQIRLCYIRLGQVKLGQAIHLPKFRGGCGGVSRTVSTVLTHQSLVVALAAAPNSAIPTRVQYKCRPEQVNVELSVIVFYGCSLSRSEPAYRLHCSIDLLALSSVTNGALAASSTLKQRAWWSRYVRSNGGRQSSRPATLVAVSLVDSPALV